MRILRLGIAGEWPVERRIGGRVGGVEGRNGEEGLSLVGDVDLLDEAVKEELSQAGMPVAHEREGIEDTVLESGSTNGMISVTREGGVT